jgi:S-DNA-T family DNA segregation ATPase FtsK/SpoIIIE
MRFPRTNFSNANTGFPQKDEAEKARAEAEREESIAKRRAYLEEKLRQAREAKHQAEIAKRHEPLNPARQSPDTAPKASVGQPPAVGPSPRPSMPLVPPLVPADAAEIQIWQSAFSLAPNVRFTRTPDSHISRRSAPEPPPRARRTPEPKADDKVPVQPLQPTQTWAAAPQPVAAETPRVAEISDAATLVVTPNLPAFAPLGSSISSCRPGERPVEEIFVPVAAYVPPAFASSPEPLVQRQIIERPVTQSSSELAYLSDFAFWDAMPLEGDARLSAKIVPLAISPEQSAAARIDFPAGSALSFYRIIEWRRSSEIQPESRIAVSIEPAGAMVYTAEPAAVTEASVAALVTEESIVAPPPVLADAEEAAQSIPQAVEVPASASAQSTSLDATRSVEAGGAPLAEPRPQIAPRRDRPISSRPMEWRPVAAAINAGYNLPPRELLQEPVARSGVIMTQETLEQNAGLLESVLEDFGVKGEIIHVRPGPVVTLYEFEPAPGVKSSRVIGLADDIARSMSALSARVAVVPGRNVIGIELPNATRETVYFREMIDSEDFTRSGFKLALGLGKTIGGEPVITELAKMPHLLVAGTTGSGKSVAINTMILSLLYRMTPEQCRLIMVDPKMLELSVYDGIPHLLTPVVTDPKKAVMALKWAVREMEDRYRKMSRLGVRNIDGYNARVAMAVEKGETIHVTVQTGFDKATGSPIEETQEMDLKRMPYIVVIVDEMADLMMVAGKEIEGAIQRLAQMARAAGIHLIMATQRPSVDVITGTIKANFPTRISFQVTSKIDSRTILGEQGAEQLLGQGDMLHMQGGGRIARVHGPFVSDEEVEKVVAHLKMQGRPEYLDTVTADEEEEEEPEERNAVFDKTAMGAEDGDDLYEQAVKVVMRDKKCSTSYIQRRLGIGYNRAASLVERMEKEGLVGGANHVGKREIISGNRDGARAAVSEDDG